MFDCYRIHAFKGQQDTIIVDVNKVDLLHYNSKSKLIVLT